MPPPALRRGFRPSARSAQARPDTWPPRRSPPPSGSTRRRRSNERVPSQHRPARTHAWRRPRAPSRAEQRTPHHLRREATRRERERRGGDQRPKTSASAASRSRSSVALRRPAERPRRSGLIAVVCSASTRVGLPSTSIVGRNDRGGADVEVGDTNTVESASSSRPGRRPRSGRHAARSAARRAGGAAGTPRREPLCLAVVPGGRDRVHLGAHPHCLGTIVGIRGCSFRL